MIMIYLFILTLFSATFRLHEAVTCSDYGIVFVVDSSQSHKVGNISQIKNNTIPIVLQAPSILASRSLASLCMYSRTAFYQTYQAAQNLNMTPSMVGIGQYSSFLPQATVSGSSSKAGLVGIYQVSGFVALQHAVNNVLVEMKKRTLGVNATLSQHAWCHSNAICSAEENELKCKCKPGWTGDGFSCTAANKLDAMVESDSNSIFMSGTTQETYQSTQSNLRVTVTKFQTANLNLKIVSMKNEGADGDD